MRVAFFDTHRFERGFFEKANAIAGNPHELNFLEVRLSAETAPLARGYPCICAFANDRVNRQALEELAEGGLKLVALRSAGFNHVDLNAAAALGIRVVRVPAYSPYSVAEHALCLILALNRKIHRAYQRVRELNFALDGLLGFDLHGKTVGVIGTGKIGAVFVRIMKGLGCKVLAYDIAPDAELKAANLAEYTTLDKLFSAAHIISLHVPLLAATRHMIDESAISNMRRGVMLINTGRGALIDTKALIAGLKSGQVGYAGLDVYEEEEGVFFSDYSERVLQDDVLARLLTFPNVLITSHQGFLTQEALRNIAETSVSNISEFECGQALTNEVKAA